MSELSKRGPKILANPIVQQAAATGLRAFGRWLRGRFSKPTPVEVPPAKRERLNRVRLACPSCGRDIAVNADGTTFAHRTKPGTRDYTVHRVRMSDGVEL